MSDVMNLAGVARLAGAIKAEVKKVIIGKDKAIDMCIMSILAGGHILIDDLPGSGKTTLVKALSRVLGCDYRRIQFTPDLLPSDIVGVNIYNQNSGSFQLAKGAVMTNILLADEINRAIPRTQSALLEAMEERQVTIDGNTYELPSPFIVMATQNQIESQSTFVLPAAQLDRFLICMSIGYPKDTAGEVAMLDLVGNEIPFAALNAVTNQAELILAQQMMREVYLSAEVKDYLVRLVRATRSSELLRSGASPRASRALFRAVRAWAAISGRSYVVPDDILAVAPYVLRHRVVPASRARLAGKEISEIIEEIIKSVAVPPGKDEIFRGCK